MHGAIHQVTEKKTGKEHQYMCAQCQVHNFRKGAEEMIRLGIGGINKRWRSRG
jgi:predicted SprT family Zn-dependent metalloprotease